MTKEKTVFSKTRNVGLVIDSVFDHGPQPNVYSLKVSFVPSPTPELRIPTKKNAREITF